MIYAIIFVGLGILPSVTLRSFGLPESTRLVLGRAVFFVALLIPLTWLIPREWKVDKRGVQLTLTISLTFLIFRSFLTLLDSVTFNLCYFYECSNTQETIVAISVILLSLLSIAGLIWIIRRYSIKFALIGILTFFGLGSGIAIASEWATPRIVFAWLSARHPVNSSTLAEHITNSIQDVDDITGGGWEISDNQKHYFFSFLSSQPINLAGDNGETVDIKSGALSQYLQDISKSLREKDMGFRCLASLDDPNLTARATAKSKSQSIELLKFDPSNNSYCYEIWEQ